MGRDLLPQAKSMLYGEEISCHHAILSICILIHDVVQYDEGYEQAEAKDAIYQCSYRCTESTDEAVFSPKNE